MGQVERPGGDGVSASMATGRSPTVVQLAPPGEVVIDPGETALAPFNRDLPQRRHRRQCGCAGWRSPGEPPRPAPERQPSTRAARTCRAGTWCSTPRGIVRPDPAEHITRDVIAKHPGLAVPVAATGTSRAYALPALAMMTSSPRWARSRSFENWVLASCTFAVIAMSPWSPPGGPRQRPASAPRAGPCGALEQNAGALRAMGVTVGLDLASLRVPRGRPGAPGKGGRIEVREAVSVAAIFSHAGCRQSPPLVGIRDIPPQERHVGGVA